MACLSGAFSIWKSLVLLFHKQCIVIFNTWGETEKVPKKADF